VRALALGVLVAACGVDDSGMPPTGGELGMNDVTFLLPLPASANNPTLLRLADANIVPATLFDRLVTSHDDVFAKYDEFHVVALRVDICDRKTPGNCPIGGQNDGVLRVVLQPIGPAPSGGGTFAIDTALHAFYPIPAAELPGAIAEVRALAALRGVDTTAPLAVNTDVTTNAEYRNRLRAFVTLYADSTKLLRLTLFSQSSMAAALNWQFRGLVRDGAGYADIEIPSIITTQQRAILVGMNSFDVMPVADQPGNFIIALDEAKFAAASAIGQRAALDALNAIENPTMHSAEDVQCVGCHVSTVLLAKRSAAVSLDPVTLPSHFSSSYDLSIAAGKSAANERMLRNLGWLNDQPAISQRVANDTAQVLAEIAARF
jgi:hypothetical protein